MKIKQSMKFIFKHIIYFYFYIYFIFIIIYIYMKYGNIFFIDIEK